MDLYTTSFSFPRPTPHSLRPSGSPLPTNLPLPTPGSGSIPTIPLPHANVTTAPPSTSKSSTSTQLTTIGQIEKDWQEVQKTCIEITTREGCLVTVTKEASNVELGNAPSITSNSAIGLSTGGGTGGGGENGDTTVVPDTTIWNFHLSGGYQSVMSARGAILREIPRHNRTTLKVPRTDILESPLATVSPLKVDVKRRLDEIAKDTGAHVAVLNIDLPGGGGVGGTVLATADGAARSGGSDNARQEEEKKKNGDEAGQSSQQQKGERKVSGGSSKNGVDASVGEAGSKGVSPTKSQGTNNAGDISSTAAAATTTNAPVTYGLETERMCELVITGKIESVELAKVRLLVMLDELVR